MTRRLAWFCRRGERWRVFRPFGWQYLDGGQRWHRPGFACGEITARPSGTDDVYKIYAESFQGADHLCRILEEAQIDDS
jgi:hypothetical protein